MATRRSIGLGVVLLTAVGLTGVTAIVLHSDDDEHVSADDPPVSSADEEVTDEVASRAPADGAGEAVQERPGPAEGLPAAYLTAGPATYATDLLGVDIQFTTPRELFVATRARGEVVLIDGLDLATHRYSPIDGLSLGFRRLAGWSTSDEAVSRSPAGSIDPYDVDAWVDANELLLLSDSTTVLSGRETRVFDVTVDPASTVHSVRSAPGCLAGWDPCFHFGAVAPSAHVRNEWVSARRTTRFYLVSIEGHEPLLIEVGAPPDSAWFTEVEDTVLSSLWLGPDAPPPGG